MLGSSIASTTRTGRKARYCSSRIFGIRSDGSDVTDEVLEANWKRSRRILMGVGLLVVGFILSLPGWVFYVYLNKKARAEKATARIEGFLTQADPLADEGQARQIRQIISQISDQVDIGGMVDTPRKDEILERCFTKQSERLLRKAKRKAKLGDVSGTGKALSEIWEIKETYSSLPIEHTLMHNIMQFAHNTYVQWLIQKVTMTMELNEVVTELDDIKRYTARYKIQIDEGILEKVWQNKLRQLKPARSV